MKTKTIALMASLILSGMTISVAQTDSQELTREELLYLSKKKFEGRDVDYYIRSSVDNAKWEVFVDAQPLAGWHHECYLLSFPKFKAIAFEEIEPGIDSLTLRPEGTFERLLVKDRISTLKTSPIFDNSNKVIATDSNNKTYALIISGGINVASNAPRYWNDCSFIYQTLRNKYRIPKKNIYAIMSDGTDPAPDMSSADNRPISQPLDLDFDGDDDIKYAATKSNITSVLNNLVSTLNSDNQLFIYVIDHGAVVPGLGYSICLWGHNEYLSAEELANLLKPFSDNNVNLNIVMGQCHSGGFITKFKEKGIKCVLATACKGNESSYANMTLDYDEFLYHWTSAINGLTSKNSVADADSDDNGFVSMNEAFDYAQKKDIFNRIVPPIVSTDTFNIGDRSRQSEHPQYYSFPSRYGKDLSMTSFPDPIDLYIKDDASDNGIEPNKIENYWSSPSISISPAHPQPVFPGESYNDIVREYKVNVKIENKGRQSYPGNDKYLHLYLSKGSTIFDINKICTNGVAFGGCFGSALIPQINPDETKELSFDLKLPDSFETFETESNQMFNTTESIKYQKSFSVLAEITSRELPVDASFAPLTLNPKESKNIAQLNVSNLGGVNFSGNGTLMMTNPESKSKVYSLEIKPNKSGENIFDMAFLSISFDDTLKEAWERGGEVSSNVIVHPAGSQMLNLKYNNLTFDIHSKESKIEGICLQPGSFGKLRLETDFFGIGDTPYYDFDLIQRDENGNVVGGMSYRVKVPEPPTVAYSDIINVDSNNEGYYTLSIDEDEFNSCVWMQNNQKLSKSSTVKVSPVSSSNTYKVAALNENGELATEEVNLSSLLGIEQFSYNSTTDKIEIELKRKVSGNIDVYISSLSENKIIKIGTFISGEKSKTFDLSSMPEGIYILSLFQNDVVIDSKKFIR